MIAPPHAKESRSPEASINVVQTCLSMNARVGAGAPANQTCAWMFPPNRLQIPLFSVYPRCSLGWVATCFYPTLPPSSPPPHGHGCVRTTSGPPWRSWATTRCGGSGPAPTATTGAASPGASPSSCWPRSPWISATASAPCRPSDKKSWGEFLGGFPSRPHRFGVFEVFQKEKPVRCRYLFSGAFIVGLVVGNVRI